MIDLEVPLESMEVLFELIGNRDKVNLDKFDRDF